MENLNEKHLRSSILKDLIDCEVDIDTYTPKIQQDSIVVVFRVKQNFDAAYDLSSFIEKLPHGILDTEAQDIPNNNGDYEIFCEFERDVNFPANFMKVLGCVQQLSNDQVWKGNFYDNDEAVVIDENVIEKFVRLIPGREINEFLEYANSTVLCERNIIISSNSHQYKMAFSNVRKISESVACEMMREGWDQMADLGVIFGKQYFAVRTKHGIIVDRNGTNFLFT